MLRNLEAEQARFGYTNADMAELLGISRVTYERKKCSGMFNRPQIDALLRLFDCKFEYLFAIDDHKHLECLFPATSGPNEGGDKKRGIREAE